MPIGISSTILSTYALCCILALNYVNSLQPCWKDAYYRGVGLAPYCFDPTWILINKICYEPCITGYK
jgi:hypothetical protein